MLCILMDSGTVTYGLCTPDISCSKDKEAVDLIFIIFLSLSMHSTSLYRHQYCFP